MGYLVGVFWIPGALLAWFILGFLIRRGLFRDIPKHIRVLTCLVLWVPILLVGGAVTTVIWSLEAMDD